MPPCSGCCAAVRFRSASPGKRWRHPQAARKVADALELRGYVQTRRDDDDGRRVIIVLTPLGEAYAGAVVEVITALNRDLTRRVSLEQLTAADAVLRAALATEAERRYAARAVRPPR